jgi:HEAT repeat protein
MNRTESHLQRALAGADPLLASDAARLIGDWGLAEFAPALMEHLRTSRFYSKVSAVYSLVKLSPAGADRFLEDLFENPRVPDDFYWVGAKTVRAAAAIGLLQMRNSAGLPWLRELAATGNPVFWRWFAPALIRLPDPSLLADLLTVDKLCVREHRDRFDPSFYSDPGMVCMLCEALGLLAAPEADEHLELYMEFHSRFVRGQACRSFYQRHPDAPTLERIRAGARRHGTVFDRLVAAALGEEIGELRDIAQKAESAFDRACAVDALAGIGSPAAEEAMVPALEDSDPYVRQCAVEGVGRSGMQGNGESLDLLRRRETDLRVLCALEAVAESGRTEPC